MNLTRKPQGKSYGYKGNKTAWNGITIWLQNYNQLRDTDINKMFALHRKIMVAFLEKNDIELTKYDKQNSILLGYNVQKKFKEFTEFVKENYLKKELQNTL